MYRECLQNSLRLPEASPFPAYLLAIQIRVQRALLPLKLLEYLALKARLEEIFTEIPLQTAYATISCEASSST